MMDRITPPAIQNFTNESVPVWMEWSGFSLADVLNEVDSPQMMIACDYEGRMELEISSTSQPPPKTSGNSQS